MLYWNPWYTEPCYKGSLLYKDVVFTGIGISKLKIRGFPNRLIFNIESPIPGKDSLFIETGPCLLFPYLKGFDRDLLPSLSITNIKSLNHMLLHHTMAFYIMGSVDIFFSGDGHILDSTNLHSGGAIFHTVPWLQLHVASSHRWCRLLHSHSLLAGGLSQGHVWECYI